MLVLFQITLGMDFLWILVEIWLQVGVQNGAKIDIKGGWKNDEKMMMARMALRSHVGEFQSLGRRKRGGVGDGVEWMLG